MYARSKHKKYTTLTVLHLSCMASEERTARAEGPRVYKEAYRLHAALHENENENRIE